MGCATQLLDRAAGYARGLLKNMIDRITPTLRPHRPLAGWQSWRDLLFLHWPVPVAMLQGLIPKDLTLDLFEGQAYVGLVPFTMQQVRPRYWPKILSFNFLETNVRTYVHYQSKDPGVYFFSLEAASRLAVWAARRFWSLPYHFAKMTMEKTERRIQYTSIRKNNPEVGLELSYEIREDLGVSLPGSFEHFLLERYLLYSEHRGVLQRGQVHHLPYPVRSAKILQMKESLLEAAGILVDTSKVPIAHYSSGVDVEIFALKAVV